MNRPLMALAGLIVAGGVAGGATLLIASSGGEEEAVKQAEVPTASVAPPSNTCSAESTSPPGMKLWRWVDVTVVLPDKPNFLAFPETLPPEIKPPSGGEGLNVREFDSSDNSIWSSVLLDAQSGTVVREDIRAEHRALQQAKDTVAVCPFEPAKASWPYSGELPANAPRESAFGMSFVRPDPSVGIFIDYVRGSAGSRGGVTPADCEAVYEGLGVRNGRSSAGIGLDSRTGGVCKNLSRVHPEDLAAFERLLSEVKACGKEIGC